MDFHTFSRFFFFTLLCLLHHSKAQITDADSSSVLFIDSPTHQYFRQNTQTNSMSAKEVGAAVSVLLGLAPVGLSAASSTKLNELLLPNPFDRPRHVFMLEIGLAQNSEAMVYADSALFGNGIKSKVKGSEDVAKIELPDRAGVTFFSLDGSDDMTVSDKQISDFATSIGGNFETVSGELMIPLPSGTQLSLHMSKKADRKFATSLINLIDSLRKVSELKADSVESNSNGAELVGGYFDGIKALQEEYGSEDITQQGMELLRIIVSRVFDSLQTGHQGEAVAVLVLVKARSTEPQRMLDVTFASSSSARILEEVKQSSNSTAVEEVILVRLTVAWATGIILIIAFYIGAYILLYMPVTKDTLLYSNVKLD